MPTPFALFRLGSCLGVGVVAATLVHGGLRAELLSDYFPAGVPGYGTAPGRNRRLA